MIKLRTIIATIAAFVIATVLGSLLSSLPITGSNVGLVVQPAICLFLAALAGAMIARQPFQGPALFVWCVYWIAVVYILYQIAAPIGQGSVLPVLSHNWLSIAASGLSAYAGALAGESIRRVRVTATSGAI
jgi:hypothetical protein